MADELFRLESDGNLVFSVLILSLPQTGRFNSPNIISTSSYVMSVMSDAVFKLSAPTRRTVVDGQVRKMGCSEMNFSLYGCSSDLGNRWWFGCTRE